MRSGKKKEQVATTTIRLSADHKKKIAGLLERHAEKSMNDYVQRLVEKDLRRRDPQPKLTLGVLKHRVAETLVAHLRSDDAWLPLELLDPDMWDLDGESVFAERSEHFDEEKRLLAERFIPWLLNRIRNKIKDGYKVYVVIDSGSTLFVAFQVLQQRLMALAEAGEPIGQLVLLTNNSAIVNAYTSFSTHKKIQPRDGGRPFGLSDLVYCYDLGGRVFSRYAAVTGEPTVAALERARNDHPRVFADDAPNARRDHPGWFISLLVGQWVRIAESGKRHPIPMARGYGQKDTKGAILRVSDECYLLSPCGKLFLSPLARIQDGLGAETDNNGLEQLYEDVEITRAHVDKIKLVTTYRRSVEACVLGRHSEKIRSIFPAGVGGAYDPAEDAFESSEVGALPAFLYSFDVLEGRSHGEQRRIEFPHIKEGSRDHKEREYCRRTKPFMMEAFSVPHEMRGK